jgi:hypothetical protein
MTVISTALRNALIRDLEAFSREVDLYPDDRLLWETIPGIANSGGNLALHAAGNLQHFIGGILGRTGYLRDREAEFGRRSGTRAELVAELGKARDVVDRVLTRLDPDQLDQPYPQPIGDRRFLTGAFLLHLATHLAFHLGQIGYLRRGLTANVTTSGAVSNAALALP